MRKIATTIIIEVPDKMMLKDFEHFIKGKLSYQTTILNNDDSKTGNVELLNIMDL